MKIYLVYLAFNWPDRDYPLNSDWAYKRIGFRVPVIAHDRDKAKRRLYSYTQHILPRMSKWRVSAYVDGRYVRVGKK